MPIAVIGGASGLLLCLPRAAHANTGGAFLLLPLAPIAFVVVVVVEAVLAFALLKIRWAKAFSVAGGANSISGLVGLVILPFSGVAFSSLAIRIRDSIGISEDYYAVASTVLFMVPVFLISVSIEYLVARRMLRELKRRSVQKWVWIANVVTYIPLVYVLSQLGL
jgi:hypothetical protein